MGGAGEVQPLSQHEQLRLTWRVVRPRRTAPVASGLENHFTVERIV
jgi:hypothetical protein